ncbi:hypothetical protein PPACK8108_LOCUS6257 [Phakopsora pachyrhizi]|uniref:Tet-like 2OG-Fe(II) oxygenase domain-containing protein n=1 Tax=Phakopsora pachyrhizi TaxID=170000 RepID=A0AAV0AUT0_PHAPC|nr:hypothetical protein PPACK8108_LOCUS6257 [Phakopsora pachyrhizi]
MDYIFGSLPNAALTPVIDEQLFRFTKDDEDIREGEDINVITNLDIITNGIPVPLLETPINTSTSKKTSNSWNLNPNNRLDYESGRISWEQEKWSLEGELWLKQEEAIKYLEYQKIQHAKEVEYKKIQHAKGEKEKYWEFQLFLVEKEREALKIKHENNFLLANESSAGLFQEKKFTNLVRINSKIKRGPMWPIGWRKAITKGYSFGIYGTGKKIKSYEVEWNTRGHLLQKMNMLNEKGLPAFSATLLNNNPPEAFSSALTFTTFEFKNTTHVDNDSSYIAVGR